MYTLSIVAAMVYVASIVAPLCMNVHDWKNSYWLPRQTSMEWLVTWVWTLTPILNTIVSVMLFITAIRFYNAARVSGRV